MRFVSDGASNGETPVAPRQWETADRGQTSHGPTDCVGSP